MEGLFMSKIVSSYIAKTVDQHGDADYTDEENATWAELFARQSKIITGRACEEFIMGLKILELPNDRIPQCYEVSKALQKVTGWSIAPVEALISFDHFFSLLANRQFPAATFIRRKEELNYLKEPDIFHEIFGHCPLLTNQAYADFTHTYGKLGLHATPAERILLARIFWFTVEFGLIQTKQGLRAYGGGILSSIEETVYCLESDAPKRKPFDLNEILRTSYQINAIQPQYFVLENFDQLYQLINMDLMAIIRQEQGRALKYPGHPC